MSKMEEEPDPEDAAVESETGDAEVDADEPFPMEWDEPAGNRKEPEERENISTSVEKDDARKIVTGEAKYTADFRDRIPDLAEAKVLRSEIAHGHVKSIDTTEAERMDGVYAVITPWSDVVPDAVYTSAGQSYPEPTPWDLTVLRKKVRMVGDPIAAVAAEDAETADRARRKIRVEYEELEPVLDMERAMDPDAPQLFDEDFVENKQPGADYSRNRQSRFEGELGDVESAFEDADAVIETEWETPYQNHCVPEPHTTLAYRDEDNRYHLISSTQVPYHTRRQLSHLFDIPIRDLRVEKPRIGAGFGTKQAMVIEPITLALTLAAERPVIYEASRREEFHAMRSRHPMKLEMKTAVDDDGTLRAMDLYALSNTGAYGPHGMTVAGNVGTKPLPIYPRVPNVRFGADIVHTNLPVGAAMRGYGAPQGHFAVESHIDEVARQLGYDPIEFRSMNHVREGDLDEVSGILGEGSEHARRIRSCGMAECIERGREAIGYDDLDQPDEDHRHRGVGVALVAQGSGVAGDELGAAHVRMNEDGSFILQVGGVDTGTGTDTMVSQIAAETLGCDPEDIVVHASDTDIAPFDYGAYASSTTYITGQSVKKAAEDAKETLFKWASKMLEEHPDRLVVGNGEVRSEKTGESVTLEEVGYESIYGGDEREQIMGEASHSTDESPPPFGAQFVDVTVDAETGEFDINRIAFAADLGVAINPPLAEGQIEGGEHMSLELATSGGYEFEDDGTPKTLSFKRYGMPRATDHPPMETILVETHEPSGPFGAKSIAELPTNGVAPALGNAIRDAVGVRIHELPITPERIKEKLDAEE
ncbi:MAG: putative selenate reductase molybdopterin-binding subunit [Halobacteriales archaeon]|jgi:putative selenate reductase molybdopterin-binding subunit